MTKDIAQKLLHGSREIDRMRQEIIQVGMMTLGLVSPKKEGVLEVPRGSSPCTWKLEIETRETGSDYYGYNIDLLCNSKESGLLLFAKRHHLPVWMLTKDVVTVHSSMDSFVDGMIKLFPEIEQKIQVFLRSAERQAE